jgi:CubicO group peptidase (beta-lactamase class C family)
MRHSPSLIATAFAAAIAWGCSSDGDDPAAVAPATGVVVTGECGQGDLADALSEWGRVGFSGAVVVDGPTSSCRLGVGRTGGAGGSPITADTVFAIGSVSKAVVAAEVLRMESAGELSLADPAGRFVDGLTGPVAEASIESLLLHTSGLVGTHGQDLVPLGRDDAVAAISRLDVDEAARGSFLYSNAGYTLLALVLEGASGVEYRQLLLDEVLPEGAGFWDGEPAAAGERARGVRDGEPTGVDGDSPGPHWAVQGNGDVAMSAAMLADWTRAVFTGVLLPPAAVDRMVEPAVDDDGKGITIGWARLDEAVLGEVALGAAGGGGDVGHDVVTVWLPESERVVVVATNSDVITAEAMLQTIGPAVVAGDPIPRPDDPVKVDDGDLDRAVGVYTLPDGDRFEVVRADDGLVVIPTGGALEALLPPTAPPAEVDEHEAAVDAMLAGATAPGAEEVEILEQDNGVLRDVRVLGSTDEGELRTYVELTFDSGRLTGWYALDDAGGVQGVDLGGLPEVRLIPTVDGFRVDGRRPADDAVTVTFDSNTMVVRGPAGTITAARA